MQRLWHAVLAVWGVIVPPSYPLVLYGVTCNQSVGDLFIAGLLPSCVVGGVLILINYAYCKNTI